MLHHILQVQQTGGTATSGPSPGAVPESVTAKTVAKGALSAAINGVSCLPQLSIYKVMYRGYNSRYPFLSPFVGVITPIYPFMMPCMGVV